MHCARMVLARPLAHDTYTVASIIITIIINRECQVTTESPVRVERNTGCCGDRNCPEKHYFQKPPETQLCFHSQYLGQNGRSRT